MVAAARTEPSFARVARLVLALSLVLAAVPLVSTGAVVAAPTHLLVSEVVTGGTSASDELIELYNPTTSPISLEGLEVIYVSASGATVSRRAGWTSDAPSVPPAGHVLVANEAGIYAPVADALYATGMAATGGSVALRVDGGTSAIDAVGWGTATSTWREGTVAVAPAPGSSIERLPGGPAGSTTDTDDNGADFVERLVPSPQNLASAPTPDPAATPAPSTTSTPSPTPVPSVDPVPSPSGSPGPTPPAVVTIAAARAAPDGAEATVEGLALTGSDFHDGGGFVVDAKAGIAVIVDGGVFERGQRLRITGAVDDRFSQRTLRADATDVIVLGSSVEPSPVAIATGAVGESVEARLVRVDGTLASSGSTLTTGTAFDLDDGSGATRVVVLSGSGVDLSGWVRGARVSLVGVVGQRDSTGSGVEGYRVMPRDAGDVREVGQPASPTPTPAGTSEPTPDATPSPSDVPEGVSTIAEARAASKNARLRVRGIVTLPTGIVDAETAVIQDATGAIVLRLGDEAGGLQLGQHVEASGMRSTKSGMETLRVTEPPLQLGSGAQPTPRSIRTGNAGESDEATLVVARGALVASARRASGGTVSFEMDDGSGPLRVSLPASLEADDEHLLAGTWVEVRGVLGQETTGAQPLRGYRIWPRTAGEITVVAALSGGTGAADGESGDRSSGAGDDASGEPGTSTAGAGGADGADATLVVGPWRELGIAGVLWDGSRVLAIDAGSESTVTSVLGDAAVPLSVHLPEPTVVGSERLTGAAIVAFDGAASFALGTSPPSPPSGQLPTGDTPAWVSLVGRLHDGRLQVGATSVEVDYRCNAGDHPTGVVVVTGIAHPGSGRVVAPCDGIRSAPLVALAAARKKADGSVAGPAAASTPVAPDDGSRPLLAGVFATAAVLVAGAALVARRLREGSDDDQPDGETAEAEPGVEPRPEPTTARLTLVRVPGEPGP